MELNSKLAEKEYQAGTIYLKMEYYRAAAIYFENVIEKYHDTPYAELAQLKKAEALSGRNKDSEAMSELEVFYRKYPNSEHKKEADELLARIRQKLSEEKHDKKEQPKQAEAATTSDQEN